MTHPTTTADDFLALQAALVGEYFIQRELGRGGMGVVYLARDVQLERDVAIKVLPAELARSPESRARFLREARTAAGLSHPHIVPIHRVGETAGFVFFVMSYVEGETLGERLRRAGPLPAADATRVMRETAWALAYAHGRGIVHRDIKPDNILLEAGTGRALVTDFGIAHGGRALESELAVDTQPGRIMGTAHFMAPEQAAGEPVDGRSDLYALGVVGYLATSGRLPFETGSLAALMVRQATEDAPGVARAAPGLPPALATVIDRCLAREPGHRFADGEAMAAALAPSADARPALPPTLRAWLATRNPLLVPYLGWSGAFGTLLTMNAIAAVVRGPSAHIWDVGLLTVLTSLPLFPIVGFHVNQARRQFRSGHTLADLRAALDMERRERAESEALTHGEDEAPARRALRVATVASGTWFIATGLMIINGILPEHDLGVWFFAPLLSTMGLGALSNALDVQFIPSGVKRLWNSGIRDRLWNSRAGEWLARRLGAPERSRAIGGGVFRPTESALGVAAGELFAALPKRYREHLVELPATVAALEARAAGARAELDVIAAMAGQGSAGAEVLAGRRTTAAKQLSESVAALEGLRLDLLRLHAGASDLAPLTTLLDAARQIGEDAGRLAEAQRELAGPARAIGAGRVPTPA